MEPAKNKKYIPAVDGLRALGVLTVLFYHLRLPFAKCGLLGVTVFFVISGYLVTKLLLGEAAETGRIGLASFWKRRLRRIMPVMILMILVMSIVFTFVAPALMKKMQPDILPSILLANNWWQIFHNVSYFAAQGAPSPLTHYWSLAIEGQFYLVWPLIVIIFVRARRGNGGSWKPLFAVTAVLTAVSAVLLAVMFDPKADVSRAYYGTDTRAFSLLAGCLLAIWEAERGPRARIQKRSRAVDIAGIVSLAVILLMVGLVRGSSPFLYRGGQVIVTVCSVLLIRAAVRRRSLISIIFSWRPVVAIGKLSYSLYIWHYPVIILISGGRRMSWTISLIEIALSFALAAAGYFIVENPFRKGAFGRMLSSIFSGKGKKETKQGGGKRPKVYAAALIAALALTAVSVGCIIASPGGSAITGADVDRSKAEINDMIASLSPEDETAKNDDKPAGSEEEKGSEKSENAADTSDPIYGYHYLLIGDSVAESAKNELLAKFPNMTIDAEISRMPFKAPGIYDSYISGGWKGEAVIYALSTNGPINDELEQLRQKMGPDMKFFIVNARAPYDEYPDYNNDKIKAFVEKDDNAYLIDWFAASDPHEDWFDGDGTHMNRAGAGHYADLYEKVFKAAF